MTMQDRLKFRVYHKPTNKIYNVYGFNDDFVFIDTLDTCEPFFREDCILLQSTGLKDKNGKLIYEGDILGGLFGAPIAWCDTCKSFCLSFYGECMACSGDVMWAEVVENDGELEVIGNIHENPEYRTPDQMYRIMEALR